MTIGFVGDEMTLKATLFICVLIVISKALVSCIICFKDRLWPLMTSMVISVLFFMRIILCCCTSSLSMKHGDAPKSNNVLISIVMDLLYLFMIGNKKQGVEFEGKLGPFWTHDASESNFTIVTKIGCPCFSSLQEVACEWKWLDYMW